MTRGKRWLALSLVVSIAAVAATCTARSASSEPATPATVIADAFAQTPVVAIGELHGWAAEHRVILGLLSDPAVNRAVDDIVVEFGNARYQRIVDRYISGGTVSLSRLRRAWLETTQGSVWSDPLYAQFFASVRRLNLSLPASQRYRVVLGDPPINLRRAHDRQQLDYWVLQRDPFLATAVQRSVVARGRHALIVAGVGHVMRSNAGPPTLTNLLERRSNCATDPKSIAADVDWCDDLERFSPIAVSVVLPARSGVSTSADALEKDWPAPSMVSTADAIGGLPTSAVVGDVHETRVLRAASDYVLYLGRT